MSSPPYVGMPALLHLEQFGSYVWDAFGHPPLLVGSSMRRKRWRDVDVRLVLPNSEYCRVFRLDPVEGADFDEVAARDHWNAGTHRCPIWVSLCLAYSALAKQMTGLPVDFQIQPKVSAEKLFGPDEPDYRLGHTGQRMRAYVAESDLKVAIAKAKEEAQ